MTKPRLAIICSTDYKTYPMGGMMSFIVDLAPHLSKFFEITLWGVTSDQEKNSEKFVELNGQKFPFKNFSDIRTGNRKIPNIVRVVYNIWKRRREIIDEQFDIVYFHGIPLSFPFLTRSIKNTSSSKIVNHIHGLTNPFMFSGKKIWFLVLTHLYEKYRKWVVKRSDLILLAADQVGHNDFTKNYSVSVSKRIKYVPNFADSGLFRLRDKKEIRQLLKIDGSKKIFISAGRLSPQKDPLLLVEAFAFSRKHGRTDTVLYIIGDGELDDKLLELIESKKLSQYVHCLGRLKRSEIALWLAASDVYVYTSHGNGFPIALVEAGMCGLPVVTTDVTGVHDIVIHEETGYLVKTRDAQEIGEYMTRALHEHKLLAKNILSQSEQFTPEKTAANIGRLFLNTLECCR